jgi:hypothetical protein
MSPSSGGEQRRVSLSCFGGHADDELNETRGSTCLRQPNIAFWRKGDTLLYGKRRESLALRSKDAALAFSLSRTRLRVGWVLRPMPRLNPRPSLGGVSREPPEVEALSWFSEEERGECPFCGERAVVGPAGARICLACDTPVHSAADEEE